MDDRRLTLRCDVVGFCRGTFSGVFRGRPVICRKVPNVRMRPGVKGSGSDSQCQHALYVVPSRLSLSRQDFASSFGSCAGARRDPDAGHRRQERTRARASKIPGPGSIEISLHQNHGPGLDHNPTIECTAQLSRQSRDYTIYNSQEPRLEPRWAGRLRTS